MSSSRLRSRQFLCLAKRKFCLMTMLLAVVAMSVTAVGCSECSVRRAGYSTDGAGTPWPDFLGLNRFAMLPAKRVAPGFRRVIPFQLLYKARSKGGEGARLQIVNFAWVIG